MDMFMLFFIIIIMRIITEPFFLYVCPCPIAVPFPCESWIWLDSQFRIALWFYVMFCAGCIAIAHCFRPLLAHPSLEAINLWKFVCPTFTCFTMFLNGCVPTKNGSTKTIPFFGVIRPKSCICLWGCSLVNPTTNKQRDISPFFLNKPLHTVASSLSADERLLQETGSQELYGLKGFYGTANSGHSGSAHFFFWIVGISYHVELQELSCHFLWLTQHTVLRLCWQAGAKMSKPWFAVKRQSLEIG